MKMSQIYKHMPKDAYSHATFLLTADPKDVTEFQELLNRHVLLGNISNDRIMRFYQNDIYFLTSFFEMAQRDPGFKKFFKVIFYSWVFEIALTRTKGGLERRLQNFTGMGAETRESGFGSGLFRKRRKTKEEMYKDMLFGEEPGYA